MTNVELIKELQKSVERIKVMQAFVNGKAIEERRISFDHTEWVDNNNPEWRWDKFDYRIKPESKYRPFKNAEECWNEMQKHQPFGWLKDKNKDSVLMNIQALFDEMLTITDGVYFRGINLINGWHGFEEAVKEYTFADGTPFGIKEEE